MSDDDVLAHLEEQLGDVAEPGPEDDLRSLSFPELLRRRSELLARSRSIHQRFEAHDFSGRDVQADIDNINHEIARRRS